MSLLVASPTPIAPRRSACHNVLSLADSFSSPSSIAPFVQTTCASPIPHILRAASPVPPPPAPVMLHMTVSPYTVIYSVFSPTLSMSATALKNELVGNPMFRYIYDRDLVTVCRVLSIARDNPGEVFSVCVRWKAPWETRYVLTELEINCAIGEFVFDVMVRRSNDLKLPAFEYGVQETVKRRLSRVDQLQDDEGGYWSGAEDNGAWDDDMSEVSELESLCDDEDDFEDDDEIEEAVVMPQIGRRVSSLSLALPQMQQKSPLRSEIVLEESEEEEEEVVQVSLPKYDCTEQQNMLVVMDSDTDVGYTSDMMDSGSSTCYEDSDGTLSRSNSPELKSSHLPTKRIESPLVLKPIPAVASLPSVMDTLLSLLESAEYTKPLQMMPSPMVRARSSIEAVIGFGVEVGRETGLAVWQQVKRHSGWV